MYIVYVLHCILGNIEAPPPFSILVEVPEINLQQLSDKKDDLHKNSVDGFPRNIHVITKKIPHNRK